MIGAMCQPACKRDLVVGPTMELVYSRYEPGMMCWPAYKGGHVTVYKYHIGVVGDHTIKEDL